MKDGRGLHWLNQKVHGELDINTITTPIVLERNNRLGVMLQLLYMGRMIVQKYGF